MLPAHGAEAPADGILRFGAHFTLGSEREGELLYLQSQRYTVHNMNYSRSVRGSERKQGVTGALVTSWQTNWEAVHLDPTKLAQIRSEGQPVLANAFVALRHTSTQLNLCSDSLVVKNHFGHRGRGTSHAVLLHGHRHRLNVAAPSLATMGRRSCTVAKRRRCSPLAGAVGASLW